MPVWTKKQKDNYRHSHPVIMPEPQPHHNFPHADVQKYFDLLFNADHPEYKGMVTVAALAVGKNAPKIVAVLPATSIGTWASQMHVSKHMDYYYSRAQHCGHGTWDIDHAFAYNAVFVDIDAHGHDLEDGQRLTNAICDLLPNDVIPCPNAIVHSGRGYHLVWLIEQVSACLGWMVKAVSTYFAQATSNLLHDLGATTTCVDMSYASNIAGLTRLPGTFNTKSGSYSDIEIIHASRMDLPKIYNSIASPSRNHFISDFAHSSHYGSKRLESLLRLAEIRPVQISHRDLFCLHLFSAAQYAGLSNPAAFDLVKSVNMTFATPLPDREVESCLSTAARKHYKFTLERIATDLDLTDEDMATIGLRAKKGHRDSNRARNARNKDRKQKRNRKIMRLYLLGWTPSEIAKKVGHAYNTIRSVITKFAHNIAELFSLRELLRLHRVKVRNYFAKYRLARTVFKKRSTIYCAYTEPKIVSAINGGIDDPADQSDPFFYPRP